MAPALDIGVIRPLHQLLGIKPVLRIVSKSLRYTGIILSRLALIISFRILSENADLSLFNLLMAARGIKGFTWV